MGAWIEIKLQNRVGYYLEVAPVWGRGLKFGTVDHSCHTLRRPRMGAWIEISEGHPQGVP